MAASTSSKAGQGQRNTLYLIDGSSYLYRAFHALPPLTSADGRPTGAVYGVVNMLNKFLQETEPTHIAVLFDARGKTFRDDIYAEYKAQRPSMPDDLKVQIEPLYATVRALGMPIVQVPGVEADDVIGTLCTQARTAGWKTVVSTIDKDMAQLVNDDVRLVNTMFDTQLDREGVIAKFGVQPEQIVDYLALVGDTSDNIPGVPGVGQKSAAGLLGTFEHLDGIYANLDRLAEAKVRGAKRIGEKLSEHREDAYLSRQLATIRCDLDLEVNATGLAREAPDVGALRTLYTELEFGTLLRQLPHDAPGASHAQPSAPHGEQTSERSLQLVSDEATLKDLTSTLTTQARIALDVHTLRPEQQSAADLVGISVAWEGGARVAYLPTAHRYPGVPDQLPVNALIEALRPLLEGTPSLVAHDAKRVRHVLAYWNVAATAIDSDLMLASYVVNSTTGRHSLDELGLKYGGLALDDYVSIAGKGAKQLGFDELEIERAAEWIAPRTAAMLSLHDTLIGQLEATPALANLYRDLELPLAEVLRRMEARGVLVDAEQLAEQGKEIGAQLKTLETRAFEEAGETFNLGSPKQLQEILFGKLGLPVSRKTPSGQPSTAEDVLEELSQDFALPRLILEHRALAKLKSTYIDSLPRVASEQDGRVRTTYHQAVAATGRLSSADPNMQNIPIRRPEGRRIRRAFVPAPGWRLISADYSQIELRIMAHLSDDENLVRAFAEDRDIHQATAAEVFGALSVEEVTADQRRSAKAINFGLIYGMSPFGLARQLGIPQSAAREYVDRYFERYPGVRRFMDDTRAQAREDGYVETVFGRRLYLPEINSRNYQRRQYAERSAINAPMQGTAADIIKRAMIAVEQWLSDEHARDARLIMQVHDELVVEVSEDAVSDVSSGLVRRMSGAAELAVPLKVEAGGGRNWEEAH
ncbi:MAG: DNA polymerase I [Pseudomonadota bacterium]